MNIGLFSDSYYPEINGVANSTYQLKKALEHIGHTVYVFSVANPDVTEVEMGVLRIHSFPLVLLKERRVSFSLPVFWIRKVAALKLDIIHTQTEFGMGFLGRKLANHLDIPFVHTYHTIYEDYTHYLRLPGNENLKMVARSFSRKYCDHADYIIVPTEKIKQLLESYGVHKMIIAQPTGVNFAKFLNFDTKEVDKIKEKYSLLSSDHILISIGRLSKEKNIAEIIEYLSKIIKIDQNVKLVIVGDGPEKESLQKRVETLGLMKQVVFTGVVSWKNIENYYAIGNAFVCASTSETQGLTYIEALATGRPILVRNDPCLEGVLQEGINGYGYDTYEEFLEGYKQIVMSEKYKSTESISKIASTITDFSVERFASKIEEVYKMAIDNFQKSSEGEHKED